MSSTAEYSPRRHLVALTVEHLHTELDGVAEASVWSMSHHELTATLTALTRLTARITELELRVAAHAKRRDVGQHVGATSTASWWAHTTHQTRATAHRAIRLADALDNHYERVRDALSAGDMLPEQARVIVEALDALPTDLLEVELLQQAETQLVVLAREHDAKALKILGRRVLEVLAPDIAEAHEQAALDAEERRAAQTTRLTLSDDGHGRTHGRFTLPTAQGEMLRKQLMALAAPRHQSSRHRGEPGRGGEAGGGEVAGSRRPLPVRLGQAFADWIERYPTDHLPEAGGTTATVVVTMDLETLLGGDRTATLDTGAQITAAQARRLACEAGIIPAVLGGPSQVLDLGRTRRFHTKTQRLALGIRDRGCTAEGCDWPPALCHAHHTTPWSRGGPTTLENGRLLCPRHHARAHDPHYATQTRPGGKISFTRRT